MTTGAHTDRPVLRDDALYLGDNGRCYCGACSGMSARYTGRDISGQRVHRVTPRAHRAFQRAGHDVACDRCGKRVQS